MIKGIFTYFAILIFSLGALAFNVISAVLGTIAGILLFPFVIMFGMKKEKERKDELIKEVLKSKKELEEIRARNAKAAEEKLLASDPYLAAIKRNQENK